MLTLDLCRLDVEAVQTVKHVPYLSNVAIRQDCHELVTAISGHDIRSASGALQLFPKHSQYRVSNRMAMFIVYLFKAIQVEGNHGQWHCHAADIAQSLPPVDAGCSDG